MKTLQAKPDSPTRYRVRGQRLRNLIHCLLVGASAFAGAACASTGGERADLPSNRIITEAQLNEISVTHLYEAVQRLRPGWLQSSSPRRAALGSGIVVAMNGSYFGMVGSLREISPVDVVELRFLEGGEAEPMIMGLRPGQHVDGAIMVQMRGRD